MFYVIKAIILFILILIIIKRFFVILFSGRNKRRRKNNFKQLIFFSVIFGIVYFVTPNFISVVKQPLSLIEAFEIAEQPGWLVYYNQEDERWGKELYGTSDYIEETGCGPTVLAMAVSSLTDTTITPKEMADWSYENGYYCAGSGSYHTLIADALNNFGLENKTTNDKEEVKEALKNGYPVISLMGKGHFTQSGHFILLCDIDSDNKVFVADTKHTENMKKRWSLDTITSEAKISPSTGGAYWIINKQI